MLLIPFRSQLREKGKQYVSSLRKFNSLFIVTRGRNVTASASQKVISRIYKRIIRTSNNLRFLWNRKLVKQGLNRCHISLSARNFVSGGTHTIICI